jgi:Rhs element Vgr protein
MAVVTSTIFSGKETMKATYRLLSIDVCTEVNRIPFAEIRILDGNVLNEYEVSDGTFFEPGKLIGIKLRYEKKTDDIIVFEGMVVRQTMEWGADGTVLVVGLKDIAVKLTTKRQSAVYTTKTDEQIIKALLKAADVGAGTFSPGGPEHPSMVQYDCSAWDFILLRAEALGKLVTVESGAVSVRAMTSAGAATHKFTWGTDMYEFEVEATAENPYKAVESVAWDPSLNTLTNPSTKATASVTPPGNLNAGALASTIGRETCLLKHPVPVLANELSFWADGRLARSQLAMLRGRITIPGNAKLKLLDTLELIGVGKRFSGKAMITAIRHRHDTAGWRTEVQFGLSPERLCERTDIASAPAAGLLPPVRGLQIGVVAAFQLDQQKGRENELRVKVILPGVDTEASSAVWARLASFDAGPKRGFYFRPEEGDEVIVGFLHDDPRHPVILGNLWGAKNNAPAGIKPPSAANDEKGIVTKSGTMVHFKDGAQPSLSISTAGGNKITIDDAVGITLKDKHGHSILMNSNGITLDAGGGNVTIKGAKVDVS